MHIHKYRYIHMHMHKYRYIHTCAYVCLCGFRLVGWRCPAPSGEGLRLLLGESFVSFVFISASEDFHSLPSDFFPCNIVL